jgi:hypothetical protein
MSRTPARITQADVISNRESLVYFVRIGKFIKIGFTTNLRGRLASFATSAPDIEVLLVIPGDRALEQRLHWLLEECKNTRELFHPDWRISSFIRHFEYGGIERALHFLEESTPRARAKHKAEEQEKRVIERRKTKAEKDAYFAQLVAERKSKQGW